MMIGVLLLAAAARADVGAAGAQSLLEPLAARPAALGEACAVPPPGADALAYNPAGLAALAGPEASAMYHAGFSGDSVLSALAGAPLPVGGIAAGVGHHNAGSVQELLPTGDTVEVSAERDVVGLLGYGAALPGTGFALGAAAEVVHAQLIEEIAGTQGAAALGATWTQPAWGLTVGASAQHLGPALRLAADRAALPSLLRGGVAWRGSLPAFGGLPDLEGGAPPAAGPDPHRFLVLAEVESRARERAVVLAGGLEYEYRGVVALRGGARDLARGAAARLRTYAVGGGVTVFALRLDYAYEILPFDQMHRVSLTFAPGGGGP